MSTTKFILNNLGIIFSLFVMLFVVAYGAGSWQAPTATPPGENTDAPVNVGASNQVKIGGLGVGPLAVFGNAIVNGSLDVTVDYKSNGIPGISRTCPAGQTLTEIKTASGIVVGGTCGTAGGGSGGGGGGPGSYRFGGSYAYTWSGANCTGGVYGYSVNTLTGGMSCPGGTVGVTSICYFGANKVPSMTIYSCLMP